MLNHEKLLVVINALNSPPVPFTLENVALLPPVPYVGDSSWNTKITITAKPGHGYSSHLDFYYHRIDLQEMGELVIASEQEFTRESVLTVLNNLNVLPETQKALLTENDLVPFTMPQFYEHGDAHVLRLDAEKDSLGWIGSNAVILAFNLPDVSALSRFFNETMPKPGYLP